MKAYLFAAIALFVVQDANADVGPGCGGAAEDVDFCDETKQKPGDSCVTLETEGQCELRDCNGRDCSQKASAELIAVGGGKLVCARGDVLEGGGRGCSATKRRNAFGSMMLALGVAVLVSRKKKSL